MSNSSPRAGTSSEVTLPEALPSSSSLPSEGRERRVGPRVAPCVASRGASSPSAQLGPARGGGSATGRSSGARWDFCFLGSFGSGGARSRSLQRTPALRGDELRVFGGLLSLAILLDFPSFGWRSMEGS